MSQYFVENKNNKLFREREKTRYNFSQKHNEAISDVKNAYVAQRYTA